MINRIAGLLRSHVDDAAPHTPSLDWLRLTHWVTPLGQVARHETAWSMINYTALREDFRRSGILLNDRLEWVESEGGISAAIDRARERDLSYVRNALSARYFADEQDPDTLPRAVELGALYVLIHRAHTLMTTKQVLEELITGVYAE